MDVHGGVCCWDYYSVSIASFYTGVPMVLSPPVTIARLAGSPNGTSNTSNLYLPPMRCSILVPLILAVSATTVHSPLLSQSLARSGPLPSHGFCTQGVFLPYLMPLMSSAASWVDGGFFSLPEPACIYLTLFLHQGGLCRFLPPEVVSPS